MQSDNMGKFDKANIQSKIITENWQTSNNSLYHSSPSLKKILSEQFLN